MLPLTLATPPTRAGIDLRHCSCADPEWVAEARTAALVIADPPWSYTQAIGASTADDHYGGLTPDEIAAHLEALNPRILALWLTWPLMGEWQGAWSTPPITGGAWVKSGAEDSGHYGPGAWWASASEPVLVYGRSAGLDRTVTLRNAWVEPPREHSRKPSAWMAQWVRRWTRPGDLIADPYAGLGAVAEAVILAGEGRRYLGAEIDAERWEGARSLVAQVTICHGA